MKTRVKLFSSKTLATFAGTPASLLTRDWRSWWSLNKTQTHLDSFMFLSPLMKITRHWLEFKDGRKHCFTLSLQDASEVKVSREALVFVLWIHGAALKSKTLLFIAINWRAFKETVIQCSHYFSMIIWSLHVQIVLWVSAEQVLNGQIKVLLEISWCVHMKLRSLF